MKMHGVTENTGKKAWKGSDGSPRNAGKKKEHEKDYCLRYFDEAYVGF